MNRYLVALSLSVVAVILVAAAPVNNSKNYYKNIQADPLPVHESGYPSAAQRCFEVTCGTAGDGGVMGTPADGGVGSVLVAEKRYISTVTSDSPVRVNNGNACVGFAPPTGRGRILNEGSTFDWTAQAAPDGGVPKYTCCAKTAGAVWQLCEQ